MLAKCKTRDSENFFGLYGQHSPVKEALEKGADLIVTSCPFCLMTLEDPTREKNLSVKELSEIFMEVL
jgi:heterodisulfide reductase subunit B